MRRPAKTGQLDRIDEAIRTSKGCVLHRFVSSQARPSGHPDCLRTLTKILDAALDRLESLGYSYNLCRSPFTAGRHKPPIRADRAVPVFAWSRYAPFPRGAGRSRCGIEGVELLQNLPSWIGRIGLAGRSPVSRATRPGSPRRVAPGTAPGQVPIEASADDARLLSAQGRRGEVRFFLQRVAGGLYVEREEIPRRGLRTMQSLRFVNAAKFNRWCDADPVRFEHPLLYVSLKRDGDDLWRIDARPADA